jgi:hypothetical protein
MSETVAARKSSAPFWLWPHWWWIALLAVAGLVIRAALAGYSLWFDELASVMFADQPWRRLWVPWLLRETNPALYYSILKVWMAAGLNSVLWIRMLSSLAGAATIAVIGWVAWLCAGPRTAIIASLLCAVSAQAIYFSQMARGYIFAQCSAFVAIGCILAWAADQHRKARWLVFYALAATLALYTHFTMFVIPAAVFFSVAAFEIANRKEKYVKALIPLTITNCVIAALGSWAIYSAIFQRNSMNIDHIKRLSNFGFVSLLWHQSDLLSDTPPHTLALRFGLTVLAAAGAWRLWRLPNGQLLLLCAISAIGMFRLADILHPVATSQTVFWFSGFVVIAVASAIAGIAHSGARYCVTGAVAAALIYNLADKYPTFQSQDWSGAIRALSQDSQAVLVVEHPAVGLSAITACHVELRRRNCPLAIAILASPRTSYGWATELLDRPVQQRSAIESILRRKHHVYFIQQTGLDPQATLGMIKPEACCQRFLSGPYDGNLLLSARH